MQRPILFALLLLLLASFSFACDINIGQADMPYTANAANTVYCLTEGVVQDSADAFTIAAENITLDCQGFDLNTTTSGNAVYSDQNQTRINNCRINSASIGIYFTGVSNSTVSNSTTATSTENGIYFSASSGNQISNSNVSTTGASAINIDAGSNYNVIINSTATALTAEVGIQISSSHFNNVSNSTAISYGGNGLRFENAENNTVIGSYIWGESPWLGGYAGALELDQGNGNSISNNVINGSGTGAISFHSLSFNNQFLNNTLLSNNTTLVLIEALSNNNTFLLNNLTGDSWIDDENGSNSFNNSSVGNIYNFLNGTGGWEVFNWTDTDNDSWADAGLLPVNSTNNPSEWTGLGRDGHPFTTTVPLPPIPPAPAPTVLSQFPLVNLVLSLTIIVLVLVFTLIILNTTPSVEAMIAILIISVIIIQMIIPAITNNL